MEIRDTQTAENRLDQSKNLRWYAGRGITVLRLGAMLAGGLLLSAAFAPLEISWLAWIALVPALIVPLPPHARGRFFWGWVFGMAHYVTGLWWLNEIGFAAGVLLAVICAVFPALWLLLALRICDKFPGVPAAFFGRPATAAVPKHRQQLHTTLQVFLLPAAWVALEWVRSWLFTGFPWNQLGVSQWRNQAFLGLVTVTGITGITYIIVAVNVSVAQWARAWLLRRRQIAFVWPSAASAAAVLCLALGVAVRSTPELGEPTGTLRVGAVQGNMPQCRKWRQEQLDEALTVYSSFSKKLASEAEPPDLIVWPETAVPAPLRYSEEAVAMLRDLYGTMSLPLLTGTVDYRRGGTDANGEPLIHAYNTAMLFDEDGRVVDFYDKIHLVPFGEFTPFEEVFPWLTQFIGMGRSLTAGSEYTILKLPRNVRAGVNICFEDVFPDITRKFVRQGANVIFTLTNDAWYAESAGSRQHLVHSVFRAVENARPLFRSGNNSDTCLILPDGQVVDLLYDDETGYRFIRAARTYEVPVYASPGSTWYTRNGDLFAKVCSLVTVAIILLFAGSWLRRKKEALDLIRGT